MPQYHTFLSHRSADKPAVEALARRIKRENIEPWLDKWNLIPGNPWQEGIEQALENCATCCVFIGPHGIGPWQNEEMRAAISRRISKGGFRVIPVLLPGGTRGERSKLPTFLTQTTWVEFHESLDEDDAFHRLTCAILGIEPGPSPGDAVFEGTNPYRGLEVFDVAHAPVFFGREALTEWLLNELESHSPQPANRFLAIVGASGSGKSSLARAGLVAALNKGALPASRNWPVHIFKPGSDPLESLALRLASDPTGFKTLRRELLEDSEHLHLTTKFLLRDQPETQRLVLLVDQFEEIFTLCRDVSLRHAFIENLIRAANEPLGQTLVVLTVRADFYARCAEFDTLAAALTDHQLLVGPMTETELRDAILKPAQLAGCELETGLVDLLVQDVRGQAGGLPLLQYAMTQLWERRQGRKLTHDGYDAIGKLAGALEQRANEIYRGFNKEEQAACQQIFLRLTEPGEGTEDTRRRATRSELGETETTARVLDALIKARLVTTEGTDAHSESFVEVSHEALIRSWSELRGWIEADREALHLQHRLSAATHEWQQNNHDEAYLFRGTRLVQTEAWAVNRLPVLSEAERAFLSASLDLRDAEKRREHEQMEKEHAQQRRFLRVVSISLVVAMLLAGFASWQWRQSKQAQEVAETKATEAKKQTDLAVARRLATAAERMLDENIGETTLAGLLAVESLKKTPTFEGQQVLRRTLELVPSNCRQLETFSGSSVVHSPDGRLTAFYRLRGGSDVDSKPATGQVGVVDMGSWQLQDTHRQEGAVKPVLSSDGHWLALAGYGRRLQVIDLRERHTVVEAHQDDMIDVAFGPTGQVLYVARTDGVIEVRTGPGWQVARELAIPLDGRRSSEVAIQVSADGKLLLIYLPVRFGTGKPTAFLVATAGGELTALEDHKGVVDRGMFSPSGDYVVTVNRDREAIIWDIQSGKAKQRFQHGDIVSALAISPDGSLVFSATRAGDVLIRDAASGVVQRAFAHESWVNGLALSRDGEVLAVATSKRNATLWSVTTGKKLRSLAHADSVWVVAFDASDRTLFTGGKEGVLRAFDVATGDELRRVDFDGGLTAIAPDPLSRTLAVGVRGTDHEQSWTDLLLVDQETGAEIGHIEHNGRFTHVLFSPDGRTLAATTGTGDVKLWDATTGVLRATPDVKADFLAFSPDSQRLIVGNRHNEAVILDASEGKRLAAIGEPGGVTGFRISPDRRAIITFGQDRTLRGWDAATGQELWRTPSRQSDWITLSGDGRRVAEVAVDEKEIVVDDVRSGHRIATLPAGKRSSLLLSEDGRRLLITRTSLTDRSKPEARYSLIALWDVDAGKRLFERRLAYQAVQGLMLPGGRLAIHAPRYSGDESPGFIDVIDTAQGTHLWSVPIESGHSKVLVPKERDDLMAVVTGSVTQVRDIATGKVLLQLTGGDHRAIMAVSRDGSRIVIATGSSSLENTTIEVWDRPSGSLIKQLLLLQVNESVYDIAFNTDGRYVLAAVKIDGSAGHRVKVWRAADWSEVVSIETNTLPYRLEALADPELFAVHEPGGTIQVRRVMTGEEVHRFSHIATAKGVAVASDAERAVTWFGASLRVWDTHSGAELAHRVSHGEVTSLAVSPDGRTIAYVTDRPHTATRGGDFTAVVLWEPESAAEPIMLPLTNPQHVLFDPTGHRLAIALNHDAVQVLDVATLRVIASIQALPNASICTNDIAFNADGTQLNVLERRSYPVGGLSSRTKFGLRVFQLDPLQEMARVDTQWQLVLRPPSGELVTNPVTSDRRLEWQSWTAESAQADKLLGKNPFTHYSFKPIHRSGKFLVRGDGVTLFDLAGNAPATIVAPADKQSLGVVTPDDSGKQVAIALVSYNSDRTSYNIFVRIHDLNTGAQSASLRTESHVTDVAFVDGGNALVMSDTSNRQNSPRSSTDSDLRLWWWRTGEVLELSRNNPVNAMAVNQEGVLFATAEGTIKSNSLPREREERLGVAQIRIWDGRTGAERRRIPQDNPVHHLTFSADGRFLAAKTVDKVLVYRVEDWSLAKEIPLEGQKLYGGTVSFASKSNRVLTGVGDGVRLWTLDGTDSVLLRHAASWPAFEVSQDGRWIATASDKTLRVWDLETGTELLQTDFAKSFAFAFVGEAGDELVVSSDTHIARIRWKTQELIAEACRRFGRDMTDDERQRLLGDGPAGDTCISRSGSLEAASGRP